MPQGVCVCHHFTAALSFCRDCCQIRVYGSLSGSTSLQSSRVVTVTGMILLISSGNILYLTKNQPFSQRPLGSNCGLLKTSGIKTLHPKGQMEPLCTDGFSINFTFDPCTSDP